MLTLIHEYAHELLYWDENGKRQSKQVKECQAEAVSYKELMAELETVSHTAAYIINRIEGAKERASDGSERRA